MALVIAWTVPGPGGTPWAFILALVGAVIGAAVAFVSLRMTEYRVEPDGLTYRPDLRIGVPVFVVLVAVLAIKAFHILRAVEIGTGAAPSDWVAAALGAVDPFSTALIAAATAYLGLYQFWLFVRAGRLALPHRATEASGGRGSKDHAKRAIKSLIHRPREE